MIKQAIKQATTRAPNGLHGPRGLNAAPERLEDRPGWSLLIAAARELHTAELLVGDPVGDPAGALPHLREFWVRLHLAARTAGLTSAANVEEWIAGTLPGLSLARQTRTEAHWTELSAGAADRPMLATHVVDARAVMAALEPEIGGKALARRGRRIALGLLSALLVFGPATAWQIATKEIPGEGPWRGAYHADRELESDPMFRRDLDVDFEWTTRGPMDEIPPDKFSIRWDSCLVLDDAAEVVFQLRANDGSRFFVDGELVIDSWEKDARTKVRGFGSATLELDAGVHHLRAEMFESLGVASAKLVASLDGKVPKTIPHQVLRYPGDEFDEADPCAAVR